MHSNGALYLLLASGHMQGSKEKCLYGRFSIAGIGCKPLKLPGLLKLHDYHAAGAIIPGICADSDCLDPKNYLLSLPISIFALL
ncbi:hypothetical protein [Collimonas humicola]|uniref:hypothetical protein n=1 Tax=Collimonas humicola TaxID=2825886 RepID=UPI001B8C0E95|nr:hypothetical protein [Collimonas humicola]